MVNTGKPSGGCKLCRARRIKCDERKPFCLRCEKSKRQCPGYRDPFETKIRDETEATINKFTNQARLPQTYQDARWSYQRQQSSPHFLDDDVEFEKYLNKLSASLSVPMDHQASCYFLSDFVLLPVQNSKFGYHQFIYGLSRRNRILPAFDLAFKAVSVMGFARRPSCRSLLPQAQAFYTKALREVTRALNHPSETKDDQVLGAVILLALYESLASDQSKGHGYSSHLRGAALLLHSRGTNIHQTPEGEEMFQLVRSQVLIFRQMPGAPPDDYSWLAEQGANNPGISTHVNLMTLGIYKIRQETDRLTRLLPTKQVTRELRDLMYKARAMLDQTKTLPMPPAVEWSDGTNDISDWVSPSTTLPGPTYTFASFSIGLLYSASWLGRMLLTVNIFRIMAALAGPRNYKTMDGYDDLVETIRSSLREIISSVPYFLGWKGKDSFKMASSPCGNGEDENPMRGGIGVMVQWPIFVASVSDFATPKEKIFLNARLRYLADVVRIKQAGALHEMAKKRSTPSSEILEDALARRSSYPSPQSQTSTTPPASAP